MYFYSLRQIAGEVVESNVTWALWTKNNKSCMAKSRYQNCHNFCLWKEGLWKEGCLVQNNVWCIRHYFPKISKSSCILYNKGHKDLRASIVISLHPPGTFFLETGICFIKKSVLYTYKYTVHHIKKVIFTKIR